MYWRVLLLCLGMGSFCGLYGEGALTEEKIPSLMGLLLQDHVIEKSITGQILQQALAIYIDQFDPQKIYLLEREVAPFLTLSSEQKKEAVQQYYEHNFALFQSLNRVIQLAIERSRRLRQAMETGETDRLFYRPADKAALEDEGEGSAFAATIEQLKRRLILNLQAFVEVQRRRYGNALVSKKKEKILRSYETQLRDFEAHYLYQNESGIPLPYREQENLFVLHILKALSKSLDAHSSFYQTEEAYDMRVRLQREFKGVGLVLKEGPDGIVVSHLLEGGPAARSKLIRTGDVLLEVDGHSLSDLSFEEAMNLLHGEKNTRVKLVLGRSGSRGGEERYEVELKRELIILNKHRVEVTSEIFGNGTIGRIALYGFYQGKGVSSEKDVRDAIEKLKREGNLRGLILDLRDNRGGFVSQAVKVAGLFITNGVIVISKYGDGEELIYRDVDGRTLYDGPLIVLTSKSTASAAEIVAQALQDYGVALVVGDEHTYGKGTIQSQTVTGDHSTSYFKVTVGKYYTVSGNTPQKEGVKADIVVPGHWSRELIGERYAPGALEHDTIPPAYDDTFQDLSFIDRLWYLKYYVPTMQRREILWREMLPTLRKNSAYRIAHNKNYQFFLKRESPPEDRDEDEEWHLLGRQKKGYGEDDLQLQESFNIMKDMIYLESAEKKEEKKIA